MLYNITDKLNMNDDPKLQIGELILTVNSDAEAVLTLMDIVSKKGELEGALEVEKVLFSETDLEKLKSLRLKVDDYILVIQTAMSLALGEDPDEEIEPEGEETRTTTSLMTGI